MDAGAHRDRDRAPQADNASHRDAATLPAIRSYRVTFTVDTYEQAVDITRAFIAATGKPPCGTLVQALDEHGEPLWAPPAGKRAPTR